MGGQADLMLIAPTYTFGHTVFGGQLSATLASVYGRNSANVAGTLTALQVQSSPRATDNLPAAADMPQLAKFARIGIVPGQDFDVSKLKADFVRRVPEIGFDRIMLQFKVNKKVRDENGWAFTTKTGIYGTDHLIRALVTAIGLGANRPQDAVYPTSENADGRKYNGANKYVIPALTANRTHPLSCIKPAFARPWHLKKLETSGKTKHAAEQRKDCGEAILAGTDNGSLVEHLRPRAGRGAAEW